MPGNITLGSNYDIEESSNGNLLIRDSTGSVVLKHTDGGAFSLGSDLELGDLVDGSTGDTVYDGSTETLGDGNQSANLESVSTTSGTIGGDAAVGFPNSTSTTALTLGGGYEVLDANRPGLLILEVIAETDGATNGRVTVFVDESGGSGSTFFAPIANADSDLPAGTNVRESATLPIPIGATVKVDNTSDPNNNNKLETDRFLQL